MKSKPQFLKINYSSDEDLNQSTEVHVVTSINQEINVDSSVEVTTTTASPEDSNTYSTTPAGSYQYISYGTPKAENVLELEKLFLNEKLNVAQDPNKRKRKVNSVPKFLEKPVKVDSTITVVSDLYEKNKPKIKNTRVYVPSTPPPTSYKAPTQPFSEEASEEYDDEVEYVEVVSKENEYDDGAPVELKSSSSHHDDLDDMIIDSVEKALNIKVPNDPQLRHRLPKAGYKKGQSDNKLVSHRFDGKNTKKTRL